MLRFGMLLGLLCVSLIAQSNFATIEGRIEDASHRAVYGRAGGGSRQGHGRRARRR